MMPHCLRKLEIIQAGARSSRQLVEVCVRFRRYRPRDEGGFLMLQPTSREF